MGKVNAHLHHFSTGEYSVAGLARIDQESTRLAAETQENLFPHAIGKGQARPGTGYIANTRANVRSRLLPFVRDINDVALLVLTNGYLRIVINDVVLTRPDVLSSITNGDFSSSVGWTQSATSGASTTIAGGTLRMDANARGSSAYCERLATTASLGTEHAVEIHVTRGPVRFCCGSSSGGDQYISETVLDTGYHSLAFTPTSSPYYVRFLTREPRDSIVTSIVCSQPGVVELPAPWTTAQLGSIRFDQSADIVFLACRNWKQRKIERRGARSWSLVEYEADDGPFVAGNDTVQMTPSGTSGNVSLVASSPIFKTTMQGSLIRLFHDRFDASFQLAGDNVFTDVFTTRGVVGDSYIINDRNFRYAVTGTWSGTGRVQRSLSGPDGDFTDFSIDESTSLTTFTTNGTRDHQDVIESNNLIAFTRIGFIDGAYSSGVMNVAASYEGFSGEGVCRITDYNSVTNVAIEVLDNFNADSGTRSWEYGAWSDWRGWPSAVVFYDGRLWWGGEDDFWGSVSDNFYSYDENTDGDSGPIIRKVATGGQVSWVNWFLPLQRLIIGTAGAEVSVRSSSFDEPLTPTNITLKDASTRGSASVSPVKVDSRGVFVHRSNRAVYALYYSFEANDYVTKDLTRLNEDICGTGIIELAVQREPETYVWAVRNDGQCCILIYDVEQGVEGWSRFVTDGVVESVCCLPGSVEDVVYLAVARTINGSTVRFIEKLALHSEAVGGSINKMADAATLTVGPATSVTLAHLANETGLIGWGTNADSVAVPLTNLTANGSGVISLGGTYTNVWVGMPYDWKYKSSKLAYGAGGGTALLQKKRISQFGLLLANTHRDAIQFGPDFTTMRNMDLVRDGAAVSSSTVYDVYDEVPFAFPGEWNSDSRVCMKGSAPYPATLLGLVVGVETNEK